MILNTFFLFYSHQKHVFQQYFLNHSFHIFFNNNFWKLWPNGSCTGLHDFHFFFFLVIIFTTHLLLQKQKKSQWGTNPGGVKGARLPWVFSCCIFYFCSWVFKTLETFSSISLTNLTQIVIIEPKNLIKTIKIFTMVIVF